MYHIIKKHGGTHRLWWQWSLSKNLDLTILGTYAMAGGKLQEAIVTENVLQG